MTIKGMLRAAAVAMVACGVALGCVGCAGSGANSAGTAGGAGGGKPVVYATFFPVKDLTERIVGDKMEVRSIITGSQEPHDFELKTSDMAKLSKADLVVYNGAGMESFIDDLKRVVGDDSRFLDLSQGLTLLKGKDVHDHDHDGDGDHDGDHAEDGHGHAHGGVNPHTWLSIRNAQAELASICDKVSALDPDNASFYRQNRDKALAEFKALDERFAAELGKVPAERRIFVVSHAAFNYLASDYGMKQVAVTGISPDEEPSAAELATIADFMKKSGVSTIFFEGTATPKVAETLAASTGARTSTLYTMESLTDDEAALGYLGLMERNLNALLESFDA
ncbi:metal ABC transporter solute-binding protein, Zn/Mn family [Berryella wangjianweii]|uniref:metal ABC transporter solute-binding protein, Zn/Mn family n=1 Tax=Berryella wangjianweii TaxID=2734634 RepID=UPI0021BDB667|nr:zinc ABC transporter substrate-binding protein [Berryella wangjianweii]